MSDHTPTPLLNGPQTVQSIRDTGYKSTDYAIAELIDNSVEAEAATVLLVVVEAQEAGRRRATTRAQEIWVIDDGVGMHEALLNEALSFGGSGHYDSRSGIGRFGMGLPQASVSQCKRTDVWTWQDSGVAAASHTYLDLEEIEQSDRADLTVPWPTTPGDPGHESLPDWVVETANVSLQSQIVAGQEMIPSGTAVRWSTLDRTRWVRSSTIRRHAEYLLGRIYRRFLTGEADRQCSIQFAIIDREDLQDGTRPDFDQIKPNDPTYLSVPADDNLEYWEEDNPSWSTEAGDGVPRTLRVEDTPLFERFRRDEEIPINDIHDNTYTVGLRVTMARPGARPDNYRNPGKHTRQGKHTRDNRGVSVMRADREIIRETTLVDEHTDRWWSVEVSFPPTLDEIFGVTNNKQEVPYLTSALRYVRQEDDADGPPDGIEAGEFTEDHPIAELYELARKIEALVRQMRTRQKKVNKRYKSNREKSDDKPPIPAVFAAVKTDRSRTSPTPGEVQHKELEQREGAEVARESTAEQIKEQFRERELDEREIETIVEQYKEGVNVQIIEETQPQAPAFFWPEELGDFESMHINRSHPANEYLLDALRLSDEKVAALTEEEAKQLLGRASDALGWLLLAWNRMELENQQLPDDYKQIRRWREAWGQVLRDYIASEPFQSAQEQLGELFDFERLGQEE